MNRRSNFWLTIAMLSGGAALLSGCAETKLRIQSDFGRAVTEDLAAQIADPDAGRDAGPPPANSGARAAMAVQRYEQNQVIQPANVGASGASGYGAIGAGAGTSGPVAGASGGSGQ